MHLLHPLTRQGLASAQKVAKATGKVQCERSLWGAHEHQCLYIHQSNMRLSPHIHTHYNPGPRTQDTVLHTHSTTHTHTLTHSSYPHWHRHTHIFTHISMISHPRHSHPPKTHTDSICRAPNLEAWVASFPTGHLMPFLQ